MAYINNVVIFGATGRTGLCCIEAALDKGYMVTAFVRDQSRVPAQLASRISIVTGDATKVQDVEDAIMGQDAIVVALGTRGDTNPTTVMSESTNNILCAMQRYGVMKISICLSTFLMWEPEKIPQHYYYINEEHKRMLELCQSTDRDWIAVCPPHITDDPGTGDYLKGIGQRTGRKISKYDLADFMVECLNDQQYYGNMVSLADKS